MKKKMTLLLFTMIFTLSACSVYRQTDESVETPQQELAPAETTDLLEEATQPSGTENADTAVPAEESKAYQKILEQYYNALTEQWSGGTLMEKELNYMMADCYGSDPFQNIGYAITDLDQNGKAELLIGTTASLTDAFYGKLIFELYTLDDTDNAVKVFESMERDRYYYAGENCFANLGSSGADDSVDTTVELNNGVLVDQKRVTDPSAYQQLELKDISKTQSDASLQDSVKVQGNASLQDSANTQEYEEESASIQLPILDEIDQNTTVGTAGSFMTAVGTAAKLLDWGTGTGLDPEEIRQATISWLSGKGNDEQVAFAEKLAVVDEAYQELLGDRAEDLLSAAGCEDTGYPWSASSVESIEAIMEAVGLR